MITDSETKQIASTSVTCYVEFVLEHSPSVSICSHPFSALLLCSSLLFCPSPSLLPHPCPYYVSVLSVSSFQLSTLGSDPFSVISDLAFILLPLLFGCNPYQPNPIAPRSLIVFCPYCLMIRSSLLYKLQQALVVLASACKPT